MKSFFRKKKAVPTLFNRSLGCEGLTVGAENVTPSCSCKQDVRVSKPKISIVIAARNEEQIIAEKLENTLSLRLQNRPIENIQIIVASDCSSDRTDQIVKNYAPRGVELVRLESRGGKERAYEAALRLVTGDIVVFTDAKIIMTVDALEQFLVYFRDPTVGAVSSIDRLEGDLESGEGLYISYEMWLRSLESEFNTLIGLSGSCFAARREIANCIRPDFPSDFNLVFETYKMGLRCVHAPNIIGKYRSVNSDREEFRRKVRTVLHGISTMMSHLEMLNPLRFGLFSWQMISHKLMRWLVPWFLIIGMVCIVILAEESVLFSHLARCLYLFLFFALVAAFLKSCRKISIFKAPHYFLLANAAIVLAWIQYFTGRRSVIWEPTKRINCSNTQHSVS